MDLGPLRPDGIVYLSATGTRRINVPNLYADLCKLLPDAIRSAGLDAVDPNPQASTEAKLVGVRPAEFPCRTPQGAKSSGRRPPAGRGVLDRRQDPAPPQPGRTFRRRGAA